MFWVVVAATAASACSSSSTVTATSPSNRLDELPTSSPGIATGRLAQGNATVHLTGAFSATLTLDRLGGAALYAPPPAATIVMWTSSTGPGGLAIAGPTKQGPNSTSDALTIVLTVQVGGVTYSLRSTPGSCSLSVTQAAADTYAGTLDCHGLNDPTHPTHIDAQGTFFASG